MNRKSSALLWFVAGLLAILILLQGCYHFPKLHRTESGIKVHLNADVPVDQATVDSWVELRLEEWIAHKADWGVGHYSDETLKRAAASEPILVHGGYFLGGTDNVMGFNQFSEGEDSRIDVTINSPALRGFCIYDPAYVRSGETFDFDYSYGLRQLPHEWTHTVRGNWHP